jgi:hypothetical protein
VSVQSKEIFILGLESVGSQGNVGKNVLLDQVILSQYVLGTDDTNLEFEKSLISLIGLKSKLVFDGNVPDTAIIDSENTKLDSSDLVIAQNNLAFGGADIETVDELRVNLSNEYVRHNRNVSSDDLHNYISEVFFNYIAKNKILTFDDVKSANLLPKTELEKYWFNTIFVVALNKDGSNVINKSLRDLIVNHLDSMSFKMIGKKHEVIPATWMPIDVLIKYNKEKTANPAVIETQMRKNILDYFDISNHELGGKIIHSDVVAVLTVGGVTEIEVMLNKDPENKFLQKDYDIRVVESENQTRKEKLLELVRRDASLVKIFQPLFNTIKTDGTVEYNYSLDVQLDTYEFPRLSDIIIERAF